MSADAAELSTRGILEEGLRLHEKGKLADAKEAYERVLRREPGNGDALHLLGVIALQSSRHQEAVELISRAIAIAPAVPEFYNDLGCALREMKNSAGAIAAWQKAISLRPDFAAACFNIADLLRSGGNIEEAVAYYRQTTEADPQFADAFFNMGHCLRLLGRIDEAISMIEQAVRIRPDRPQWQYRLRAIKGDQSVTSMPPEVVRRVFDTYAPTFDTHLLGTLKYSGPKLLFEDVLKTSDRKDLDILDLGCGTGLCGVEFRPYAREIVGVDLSPEMLKAAEARGIYDRLIEADVVRTLQSEDHEYDLIVAGDVLIYVGDLTQFISASARRLKDGGLLAFTAEKFDGPGFHLEESGRFSHSIEYIRDLAASCGLNEVSARTAGLRKAKKNSEMAGWIVVLQKPG